ncbi:MAG: hypothetical protein LBI31_07510 [Zoogloeaceae bacterium]|jgi:hypothetical protein|nr:hypothetical protein [Zoogloeaceae bacterium]
MKKADTRTIRAMFLELVASWCLIGMGFLAVHLYGAKALGVLFIMGFCILVGYFLVYVFRALGGLGVFAAIALLFGGLGK